MAEDYVVFQPLHDFPAFRVLGQVQVQVYAEIFLSTMFGDSLMIAFAHRVSDCFCKGSFLVTLCCFTCD